LLLPGSNGWGYPCGHVAALAACLQQWMQAPAGVLQQMGEASKQRIAQYSFAQIAEGLQTVLQSLRR
jgi:glycosyltransferase involved in cell wall biosynthesis